MTKEKADQDQPTADTQDDEPKWKLVERIAGLLEQALTPDAVVQHDVELPDITTGHMRQCDVVIRYGRPPRQTLAIVEVQDRKSKVEISHLQAWWEKMLAVGAQHLICVSALDYPQSVKDEVAKKRGPAVKLMRLRQLVEERWPLDIAGRQINVTIPTATLKGLKIELDDKSLFGDTVEIHPSAPVFRRQGAAALLSALDLFNEAIDSEPRFSMLPPGRHESTWVLQPGRPLWLEVGGVRQSILRLNVLVESEAKAATLPLTFSEYTQVNYEGTLAWAATARGAIDDRNVKVQIILRPNDDGTFTLAQSRVAGPHANMEGWFTFTPATPTATG